MREELKRILPLVQKPARYTGGEYHQVMKNKDEVDLTVAFCFPDTYEIGMSYLGLKILTGVLNQMEGVWCQRCFAPWFDMEEQLRKNRIPLYALESGDPLSSFDILAFTLQYEMSYSNVLNMMDLAGVPLWSRDRGEDDPIVMAGGPCAYNPEPMADFLDIIMLGEGEEVIVELAELIRGGKKEGASRQELLRRAAQIPGVYVPSLYEVRYHEDGTVAEVTPREGAPAVVTKRIIQDVDRVWYPTDCPVPSTEVVHDRVQLEIFRGCIRGCRFCQAGYTNRPVRAKDPETLVKQAMESCENSGYEEVSLLSLSTSDYRGLRELTDGLLDWCQPRSVSLSLPSLRADNFSVDLMERVQRVRKSGLTFAPEAGSQRLRDAINKNVREEDVLNACAVAFQGGWSSVKLYFMLGLPTETDEDILGIGQLAQKVFHTWQQNARNKARGGKVTVSAACFIPKPMTPFQWEPQCTMEEFQRKQEVARSGMRRNITFHWHDAQTSYLEAVLARGDRRLSRAVYTAWRRGARMDSWGEGFDLQRWLDAIRDCGLDPAFYAHRARPYEEVLPWDHLSAGVSRKFLWRERERAYASQITPDCRHQCTGCGASCLLEEGRRCDA